MKKIVKIALVAVVCIAAWTSTKAQLSHLEDPRFGDTPEQREANAKALSFLKGEYDMKNWDGAAGYVGQLLNDTPKHPNVYIWGTTVYRNRVGRAKTLDEKKILVDSVMLIYDRRIENFPDQRANLTQQKARDYIRLNPMDRPGVRQFYKDAVEAAGEAVPADLVIEYFQQLVTDFKGVEIKPEELLAEYGRLSPMMDSATEDLKDRFTGLFATSGAASCEVLEELYAQQLAGSPDDVELITKAYNMMSMIGCQSDFYFSVAEKYYAIRPSSDVAIRMAFIYENRKDYDSALKYLNEVLPSETDPIEKANIYTRMAASELGAGRSRDAAQAARQAIALDPDNAGAHYFLAESYLGGSAACDGFFRQTVYWLADDEFVRARRLAEGDAGLTEKIDARISVCRANFPQLSEGFMYVEGYEDGKSYTVSCGWISGTTTIRSKK